MKILIDIGHPAHVHYFKYLIKDLKRKGNEFLIVARDKEVSHKLLDAYQIPYVSRGKGKNSAIGKLLYLLKADLKVLDLARKFQPDLFLSVASPYAAQVSWLMKKPHIAIDDTEAATTARKFYLPFSTQVITPNCFEKDLGEKQLLVNSFTELFYLHPNRYAPKPVERMLDLKHKENYVLLRFVSWNANHDIGQRGISIDTKSKLIEKLEKLNFKIFISAEGELPSQFEKYGIKISPEKMHDVLASASLFIGEGATMASECVMLGTPAIYVNSLTAGTLNEQSSKYGLISLRKEDQLMSELEKLLQTNYTANAKHKMEMVLQDKIDFSEYLINYIESLKV